MTLSPNTVSHPSMGTYIEESENTDVALRITRPDERAAGTGRNPRALDRYESKDSGQPKLPLTRERNPA